MKNLIHSKKVLRIFSLILCFSILFSGMSVFAGDKSPDSLNGIAYNLLDLSQDETISDLTLDTSSQETLILNFTAQNEMISIAVNQTEENKYETIYNIYDNDYSIIIMNTDNAYSGYIRNVKPVTVEDNFQFGFIFDQSNNIYDKYLSSANNDSEIKKEIDKNKQELAESKNPIASSSQNKSENNVNPYSTLGAIHVKCQGSSIIGFKSGVSEVWADSYQFGGQGRYVTITHYNVDRVVLGDGVSLSKYTSSTPSQLIWGSPSNPGVGLQTVGRQFLIPFSYSGKLEATTTSYFLIDKLPVPILHFESTSI